MLLLERLRKQCNHPAQNLEALAEGGDVRSGAAERREGAFGRQLGNARIKVAGDRGALPRGVRALRELRAVVRDANMGPQSAGVI